MIDEEKNVVPVHFLPRDINNCLEWKKISEENLRQPQPQPEPVGSQDSDAVPRRRLGRLTTLEMHEISPIPGNEGEKSASPTRRKGLNSKVIFLL